MTAPGFPSSGRVGLSLIEVLVASTTFVMIFMGIASIFQSTAVLNKNTTGLSDCMHHYRNGFRLLTEGSPAHAGLLSASSAEILVDPHTPATERGRLRYTANGSAYQVWVRRRQLVRKREPDIDGLAVPLMGNAIPAPPANPVASVGVMIASETSALNPVAVVVGAYGEPQTVRFDIQLHYDLDGFGLLDSREARLRMTPLVHLRNRQ